LTRRYSNVCGAPEVDGGLFLPVAHSLRGEGFDASEDGTGRGTPLVPVLASTLKANNDGGGFGSDPSETFILVAIQERAVSENIESGPQGKGYQEHIAYTLEARNKSQAVVFQCQGGSVGEMGALSDPCPSCGEIRGGETHGDPIAFDLRGRKGGSLPEGYHDSANIRAANGGSSRSYIAAPMAVRRLTPVECARLQGFPDDYLAQVPWRGKATPPMGRCTRRWEIALRFLVCAGSVSESRWLKPWEKMWRHDSHG
jgi:DNA (cytosine-5)-methyltransferase 1